jgi:hypothetical protein
LKSRKKSGNENKNKNMYQTSPKQLACLVKFTVNPNIFLIAHNPATASPQLHSNNTYDATMED